MSTPPSPMISMYAPDGTLGDIPYERMHDAMQAGGKLAVNMIAPDGTRGYIPADRVQDAQKAGGKVVPYSFEDADGSKPGFWKTLGQDLVSGAKQLPHALVSLGDPAEGAKIGAAAIAADQQRQEEGRSPGYRTVAAVAPAVGVDPTGMEEAARQGNPTAVLGHAAANAVPVAAGEALRYGAPKIAAKVGEMLPSTERAGAQLQEVRGTAGHIPIDMEGPGKTALELYTQSQRGATLPKVVRDFVNRATKPGAEPITYAEAKDFQSNISRLSANERMNLNPNTQRLLMILNSDLKASLAGAADVVGKGDQFTKAMKEYHDAMTVKGWSEAAKANAFKFAVGSAAGALGLAGAKKIWDAVVP